MKTVAFLSAWGGTGQSALVANLACELAVRGQEGLAVDLCPQNALSHYLGEPDRVHSGWTNSVLDGGWWGQTARQNSEGAAFLPHGSLTPSELYRLHQTLSMNTAWLDQQVSKLQLPPAAAVLLDVPAWPSFLAAQALRMSDSVIICLNPGPLVYYNMQLLRELIEMCPHVRINFLITRFSPRRTSQAEVTALLREQWNDWLLPVMVHEDDGVALAQLHRASAIRAFPHSQFTHDIRTLADWLVEDMQR